MTKVEIDVNVTISKKDYDELMYSNAMLAFLESWGVENWEGYEMAMEEFENYWKGKCDGKVTN